MNDTLSLKEIQTIKHDFLVIKIILKIKEQDVANFQIIEKMIDDTMQMIDQESNQNKNIIDNNIFELTNLLDDFKYQIEDDFKGNIYILLLNNNNDYLNKLLKCLDDLTIDYSVKLLKMDLIKYFKKIINDYLIQLKECVRASGNLAYLAKIDNIFFYLEKELTKDDERIIYKETKSIIKFIMENNLLTNALENKYYLFELAFIINMVN